MCFIYKLLLQHIYILDNKNIIVVLIKKLSGFHYSIFLSVDVII